MTPEEAREFFAKNNLPKPPSFPTAEEVKKEAEKRAKEIFADRTTLRKVLDRHEDVIRKRWMKKTKEQRKKVLLTAFPQLPPIHRPDYLAFRMENKEQRDKGTKFGHAFLRPYLNVEDLVRGKTLLLLLNSRGRNEPPVFAHADHEAAHLGLICAAIRLPFLNEYTMVLDGDTPESYGRLISWSEDKGSFDLMITGRGFHPGEGLMVLEIQQGIWRFLIACCRNLLLDLSEDTWIGDEIPVQPEPPALVGDHTEWPSVAAVTAEAPYRLPAHIDFERLRAVVSAKRAAAEDHVWSLREDPGYFADMVSDWSEHRQETLVDTNGRRHPNLDRPLFWNRVIGGVVFDAHGSLIIWDLIESELNKLVALKEKHADDISPDKNLPAEYLDTLLKFRHLLDQASKGPILNLKSGVPASPPLRNMFVREPQKPGSTMIVVKTKSGLHRDQLMWIFQSLWDEKQLHFYRLPDLLDEMERLVHNDPAQKERLSSWVTRVYSDLGVIAAARHELSIYMPWASGLDNEHARRDEEIKQDFVKKSSFLAGLERNFKNLTFSGTGSPADGKFTYPSDQRRTEESTETMRIGEQNLDKFWQSVDQQYQEKTGKSLQETMKHLFAEDRELERTPAWVEPPKRSRKQAEGDSPESSQRTNGVKANGTAKSSSSSASKINWKQQPIPVGKRALKVLSTLFHVPNQSEQPGEVLWGDFLHAMAAVGFQPQKLYGSVWQFTPTSLLDVKESIQFNEPHPRNKLPFKTARRIGKRLNRTYGWDAGSFELA
ncbi:hypothetical protein FQN54_002404 [Arachnomyces sp. PD_36]|nr:hypothetical protein FQN54_002404 [Arachnomyces sp. PD_36]